MIVSSLRQSRVESEVKPIVFWYTLGTFEKAKALQMAWLSDLFLLVAEVWQEARSVPML